MKKIYFLLGLIAVYSFLAVAMNHKISKEKLEGRWNVKVAAAPDDFQECVLNIKNNKGQYSADILFVPSEYRISDQAFTLKNKELIGDVNVGSEQVLIKIREEKGHLYGTVQSPSFGSLPMIFTRLKE